MKNSNFGKNFSNCVRWVSMCVGLLCSTLCILRCKGVRLNNKIKLNRARFGFGSQHYCKVQGSAAREPTRFVSYTLFTRTVKHFVHQACFCLGDILSVKNFQRTSKMLSKNDPRTKFFTLLVNEALDLLLRRRGKSY